MEDASLHLTDLQEDTIDYCRRRSSGSSDEEEEEEEEDEQELLALEESLRRMRIRRYEFLTSKKRGSSGSLETPKTQLVLVEPCSPTPAAASSSPTVGSPKLDTNMMESLTTLASLGVPVHDVTDYEEPLPLMKASMERDVTETTYMGDESDNSCFTDTDDLDRSGMSWSDNHNHSTTPSGDYTRRSTTSTSSRTSSKNRDLDSTAHAASFSSSSTLVVVDNEKEEEDKREAAFWNWASGSTSTFCAHDEAGLDEDAYWKERRQGKFKTHVPKIPQPNTKSSTPLSSQSSHPSTKGMRRASYHHQERKPSAALDDWMNSVTTLFGGTPTNSSSHNNNKPKRRATFTAAVELQLKGKASVEELAELYQYTHSDIEEFLFQGGNDFAKLQRSLRKEGATTNEFLKQILPMILLQSQEKRDALLEARKQQLQQQKLLLESLQDPTQESCPASLELPSLQSPGLDSKSASLRNTTTTSSSRASSSTKVPPPMPIVEEEEKKEEETEATIITTAMTSNANVEDSDDDDDDDDEFALE